MRLSLNAQMTLGAFAFVLVALTPLGALSSPSASDWSNAIPPVEYHGNAQVAVRFVSHDEVIAICGPDSAPLPAGLEIKACAYQSTGLIISPNPCTWAESEYYAKLMCHEKAHLLGWRHD